MKGQKGKRDKIEKTEVSDLIIDELNKTCNYRKVKYVIMRRGILELYPSIYANGVTRNSCFYQNNAHGIT